MENGVNRRSAAMSMCRRRAGQVHRRTNRGGLVRTGWTEHSTDRTRESVASTGPWLAVAVGGAIGAGLRWAAGAAWVHDRGGWPWATLIVNLIGCVAIGVAARRLRVGTVAWAFVVTGVLGGFTTFSSFAVEVDELIDADRAGVALGYVDDHDDRRVRRDVDRVSRSATIVTPVLFVVAASLWSARASGRPPARTELAGAADRQHRRQLRARHGGRRRTVAPHGHGARRRVLRFADHVLRLRARAPAPDAATAAIALRGVDGRASTLRRRARPRHVLV